VSSDDDADVLNPGGFNGRSQKYPYVRPYNLYLDPEETRSYLIRKLANVDAVPGGNRSHLSRFGAQPAKTGRLNT